MGFLLPRALPRNVALPGARQARRHPRLAFWGAWIGGGFAIAWALNLLWWAMLEPLADAARVDELVIPEGTAAAVAAGQPAPFIPDKLSLGPSAELRVRNLDITDHTVGGKVVPPGGVAVLKPDPDSNQLACTVHPSGYVGLRIDRRPGIQSTLLPAALLGLPFGIAFGVVAMVARRISMDDEPEPGQPKDRDRT